MKLNNKGFAITGFLYSIFAIFLVILSLILISMTGSKLTLDKIKSDVKKELDEPSNSGNLYEKIFSYTGTAQEFVVPYSGWYMIELWGGKGGSYDSTYAGGNGAYTSGKIYLNENEQLNIYIGGEGIEGSSTVAGGYNGGGSGSTYSDYTTITCSGGGATDIRIGGTTLNDRIMVAGGGGGAEYTNNSGTLFYANGGAGGTLVAENGGTICENQCTSFGTGGTQISGGYSSQDTSSNYATFGEGASSFTHPTNPYGAGGGGGYYGGGSSSHAANGGGGGSSFISGYSGVNAITSIISLTSTNNTIHYSGKYFIDGKMQSGVNRGNGKAKITYLSDTKPNRVNSKLNNVRYIRDCANGSSNSGQVEWVELEAIKDGVNIAKGKGISSTINGGISGSYDMITDGDITSSNYVGTLSSNGLSCVTIDLGEILNLDEIAVWHYWLDGRTYNSNVTYVSIDNSNWISVISTSEVETSNGKRVSAYID